MEHKPVLLKESIDGLLINPTGIYVDGTLGRGGHSLEIVKKLNTGKLIAIDCDETAIAESKKKLSKYDEIITYYGSKGRYFISHWGSGTSYDIACYLFEVNFDDIYDAILITSLNNWTSNNDRRILEINNNFIKEAREEEIKQSIIFQILHEIVLRMKISG